MGRGRFVSASILSFVLFIPAGQAFMGLDVIPQSVVQDPEGNVQYDPLYPGPDDHEYIDLTEVTIGYDAQADELVLTLFVVSSKDFASRTSESMLIYEAVGDFLVDDAKTGTFSFNYTVTLREFFGPSTRFANVTLCQGNGESDCQVLEGTTFTIIEAAPGAFEWRAPRAAFLWYGNTMANFGSGTAELYSPQAMFNVPIRNTNAPAWSNERFELADLLPEGVAEEDDPLNGPVMESGSQTTTSSDGSASAIGVIAAVAALGVTMMVRRRGA